MLVCDRSVSLYLIMRILGILFPRFKFSKKDRLHRKESGLTTLVLMSSIGVLLFELLFWS